MPRGRSKKGSPNNVANTARANLAFFNQQPQTTRTNTQLQFENGTPMSGERIAWNLAQTAGQGQTDGRPTPRHSASPPAFPPRPRAQMERRPFVPESGLDDVEASLLAIESYPARLAPPPATLPGFLPRQQLSRGSQESDIVPAPDRRVVPGPGAPPGSAARAQLSSVTAADIIEAFPEVSGVPAWMTCTAPAGPRPTGAGALPGIPMVGSSVSTAREGRVMPPRSARIVDVHPRPAYTGPSPGRPQATIPGPSARVSRVPSSRAPTVALPALPPRNSASRAAAPVAGSAARAAALVSANRFGLRIPDASASVNPNDDISQAKTDHESVLGPLSKAVHNHYSLHNVINNRFTFTNPNTTLERLNNPILGNEFSASVIRNAPTMSANSASAGESSAAARVPYTGPSAPLSEEETRRIKNEKKNNARRAKKTAAKAETYDTSDQGDDGDDAIPTNALPTNPAMNQPSAIPAKDKGKIKADDAIPTISASAIPAKDKRKMKAASTKTFAASITAAENWMKPSTTSTTNTMTPEDTQAMVVHFMAKFRKNKERHRAVSPPRQTTQYTAEEKYQHVIAGMLKSQGITSSVKTRTQVRRDGPTPNILSTEGGSEMSELAQQLSDMLVADTEGIESEGEEEEEARKEMEVGDDDTKEMSYGQLLDPELIKKGTLSQLRAVVAQIDKSNSALQAKMDIDLVPSLSAQRGRISCELALLKVEDRTRRAFLREDTTSDGRRGRLGMREGCAIPMDDPPVARSMGDIERCALQNDAEGEAGGMERPVGGSEAT